jgi:hypothetical protein
VVVDESDMVVVLGDCHYSKWKMLVTWNLVKDNCFPFPTSLPTKGRTTKSVGAAALLSQAVCR